MSIGMSWLIMGYLWFESYIKTIRKSKIWVFLLFKDYSERYNREDLMILLKINPNVENAFKLACHPRDNESLPQPNIRANF